MGIREIVLEILAEFLKKNDARYIGAIPQNTTRNTNGIAVKRFSAILAEFLKDNARNTSLISKKILPDILAQFLKYF